MTKSVKYVVSLFFIRKQQNLKTALSSELPVSFVGWKVEELDFFFEIALTADRLEPPLGPVVGRDQGRRDGDCHSFACKPNQSHYHLGQE